MVGRRERIKDSGISEREYKVLFLIAGLFSIVIALLSLFRRLSSSWVARAFLAGVLSTILIYYSTIKNNIKLVLTVAVWSILLFVVAYPLSYGLKTLLSLSVVLIAIYAWVRRPLPSQEK